MAAKTEILSWFERRGWTPFAFQCEAWAAYARGRSGLIHAPTGLGKTMAAWLGPVMEGIDEHRADELPAPRGRSAGAKVRPAIRRASTDPLRVLWLTPLRALASDTLASLELPVRDLGLNWSIEKRTGDTSASVKLRQKDRLPTALVTTPESLSVLLSYPASRERFSTLRAVVVDEWHELMGTKRGVQTELALARLRRWLPGLRIWGVSATMGNLEQARDVLLGVAAQSSGRNSEEAERAERPGESSFDGSDDPESKTLSDSGSPPLPSALPPPPALIRGNMPKELRISTIIPKDPERFPWAGHLGLRAVEEVIERIERAGPESASLLFTNTRSQAEIWFRRIMQLRDDWIGQVAIHHGSLDRAVRDKVEALLDAGKLRCVVCTSSLDLGVDFQPVDQVFQLGSPKGIARLVQRAGRSGHRPGAASCVVGVPTHSFELVEFAAARDAALAGRIESRVPLERPFDVLVQHIVTCACGTSGPAGAIGFVEADLLAEVRTAHAYRNLTGEEWTWAMDFCRRGGQALTAYPEYARIVEHADENGEPRWRPSTDRAARMHRMSIGTITADQSVSVKYLSGRTLGTIEEGFIARLTVGQRFVFAGKVLELLRVRDMAAYVRPARNKSATVPTWNGGRFPLSSQLAAAVRAKLDQARTGVFDCPEMDAARPTLELQRQWSRIPAPGELLAEHIDVPGSESGGAGSSAIVYPFAGRLVHEGLGALAAYRLSRLRPITVISTCNDYGFSLQSRTPLNLAEADWRALLSTDRLVEDLLVCLNTTELARRQFRDIARVAGLIVQGFPGRRKSARQLQASSGMFYEVFDEFDPGNLLLSQARREVLEAQLEINRLRSALEAVAAQPMTIVRLDRLTPLAFPIWAEHLRSIHLSSEKWNQMVARMAVSLEAAADIRPPTVPRRAAKQRKATRR